ncbi:hypothetical protein B0T26DRAFT_805715 [Lasiosphaeria miniovina]|uniref:Uncharacterized protein n=1 Tax=Lasiosphaeria miniovina TaxID=1954250 RepID=A0AA40A6H9_9PEZI|nr:uncharacterized protein B0T26DRAFT_805715 [Lasiosphaeria miniovina]KAK0710229.1 hypothetical protein B0T26DRAFT_805715 [Lasiosphaeria miniovina]
MIDRRCGSASPGEALWAESRDASLWDGGAWRGAGATRLTIKALAPAPLPLPTIRTAFHHLVNSEPVIAFVCVLRMRCSYAVSAAFVGLFVQGSVRTQGITFLPSSRASCTPDNATPIEQYISSGPGGGGGGGGPDPGVFLSYDIFQIVSNAVKKRMTPNAQLANIAYIVRPRVSPSLSCTATEMCFSVSKAPFCLDITTGAFRDGAGTTGNALSGDYTLSDGRKGNLYNGSYPLPSGMETAAAATTPAATNGGLTANPGASSATANPGAGSATANPGTGTTPAAQGAPTATGGGPAPTTTNGAVNGLKAQGGAAVVGVVALIGAVLL